MKKIAFALAGLGLAVTVWGLPRLNADEKGPEHGGRMMEMMKKKLELSDAQTSQMEAADKANRETSKPLIEKLKLDTDRLRVLVDKKAADKDLSAALDDLKADHKAVQAQREKHMEDLRGILTPLQQAKAVIAMMDRGGMMGGRGHDGRKDGHDKGKGGQDDKKGGDEAHEKY